MGSSVSKLDNLNLVDLCRERKELTKELVNCRYDFVSAHVMHFQSLLDVGNALDRFLEEFLAVAADLSCDNLNEGSHLKFSSSDEGSQSKFSSSDEVSHLKFHSSDEGSHLKFPASDDRSHLNFRSSDSESVVDSLTDYVHGPNTSGRGKEDQGRENSNSKSRRISSDVPAHSSPGGGRYTQHVSASYVPIIDTSFVQDDNMMSPNVIQNILKSNAKNVSYRHSSSSRTPMESPYHGKVMDLPRHGKVWSPANNSPLELSWISNAPIISSRNSPEAEFSAWNYYNPFSIDVNNVYSYDYWYSHATNGDDTDLRKVRENEGIPDLEYETERSSVEKGTSRVNESEEDKQRDSGSEDTNFNDDVMGNLKKESNIQPDMVENHTSASSSCSSSSFAASNMEGIHEMEVGESSEVDEALADNEKDSEEALKKIKYAFENAFKCGKEVNMLLEAGKLPYLPTSAKFKVLALRILSRLLPFRVKSSKHHTYLQSSKSSFRTMKATQSIRGVCEEDVPSRFGNLSSIFEELYAWEKKLQKEVKGIEKLRMVYDKKYKMLKTLDDRGSEFTKIDTTHASIKQLLPRIKVFISAIDTISARIHKLRDEDLHSEVNELIHGLSRMWKMIIKCHQKQLQAIREAQTSVHIAGINMLGDSGLKTTLKLEEEVLKWATRFSNYFKTQKAFAKLLNKWLSRYLYQEREETLVGTVPLSPSTIGAPPIFITSNDWCNALWNISEERVYSAICGFAMSLRHLHDMREEERQQKIGVENLMKKMQYLNPTGSDQQGGEALNDDASSLRKLFQEQIRRHEETVKLVNDAVTNCFRVHLVSIFEALELFCLENLKAYDSVRIQITDGNLPLYVKS